MTKTVKLVVLGGGTTGKTSLLIRYATNAFPVEYIPTVFDNESVTQSMDEGDEEIDGDYTVGLWDTGGGEDYARLRPLCYPQTDVFLLGFPVNRRSMFKEVRSYWKPEIRHHMPDTPFIVVATKTDLRSKENKSENGEPTGDEALDLISKDEGLREAESLGAADYVECSALLGEGVSDVFKAAIRAAVRNPTPEPKKKKCALM